MAQDSIPEGVPATAALLQAYLAAAYRVRLADGWQPLRIGEPAPALAQCLPARAWTLVTAWNPQSLPQAAAANAAADAALQSALDAAGLRRLPATGGDAAGTWHEDGWLVADLPAAQADRLAQRLGQAGVLHWRHGEPVRLRMYRPRPAGIDAPPWVDWVPAP